MSRFPLQFWSVVVLAMAFVVFVVFIVWTIVWTISGPPSSEDVRANLLRDYVANLYVGETWDPSQYDPLCYSPELMREKIYTVEKNEKWSKYRYGLTFVTVSRDSKVLSVWREF